MKQLGLIFMSEDDANALIEKVSQNLAATVHHIMLLRPLPSAILLLHEVMHHSLCFRHARAMSC